MRLVSVVTSTRWPELGHLVAFVDEVVDLRRRGADFHGRIDQPGRADDLLDEDAAGALHLPAAGRRRDVHRLRPHGVPFLEAQRAIVHARGQAEAVLGQRRLAPVVAAEHAADLRHGDVALVGEHQRVVGQVLEQRRRRLAGIAARQIARVVLDAGAATRSPPSSPCRTACAARGAAPPAGGRCDAARRGAGSAPT